ncbi:xanthine dehydrogenase family protein molybdopterin-binding subunit [Saccharopolyspora griseoalba]|uniref:Molybdopterin cofactor-binding domain-containing protein n=1 Tax=Saccharopolyspora griseoalba TaxID=1431848 RepID=A0ABW2LH08_9PSEU
MVHPVTDAAEESAPPSGLRRRRFLAYLAAAPTLTIATRFAMEGEAAAAPGPVSAQLPLPPVSEIADFGDVMVLATTPTTALMKLEFTSDNKVLFELPRLEVGQGLNTSVAMIIAEELGARVDDIAVKLSDARPELVWNQFTAGSTSIRTLWNPLRHMAAAGRARLITAAAQKWGVPADKLTAQGTGIVGPGGRKATFGELAGAAAKVLAPAVSSTPKDASAFEVVGKGRGRNDARAIVTGEAQYVSDIKIPGALVAVVVRPPTLDGEVESFDDSAARSMPGFQTVAEVPTGVAVVADYTWQAMEAAKKLQVTWKQGPLAGQSDSDVKSQLAEMTGTLGDTLGDSAEDGEIDESFDFAFVSHAPMEINYAVADVSGGQAEIWTPAQSPVAAQKDIAAAIGMPLTSVKVNVTRAGGSFGRHLFHDAAIEAAQVSQAVGKPIKLFWTRNDDTRHGRMRPASHHRIRASARGGSVQSWAHKMSTVQVDFTHGLGDLLTSSVVQAEVGKLPASQLYFNLTQAVPYDFGVTTISLNDLQLDGVHTGSWRSVHSATFRTAEELVVDELADQAGVDRAQFRMDNLKSDRAKTVLRKVMENGDWGSSTGEGKAQGICVHEEYRSVAACLVEVDASDPENPRVTKARVVADVGQPINPRGVEAQLQGGLVDAISTVLRASIHIDDGAVREGSYGDFLWARQRHTPRDLGIEVMPATTGDPGGVGELGVPVAAGAIATAYAKATGTRPRSFPVNH